MTITYNMLGTCARQVKFDVEDGVVSAVQFFGGCNGNLKGLAKLADGMKVEDVIERLSGIQCGFKSTSCPDQLAKALESVRDNSYSDNQ